MYIIILILKYNLSSYLEIMYHNKYLKYKNKYETKVKSIVTDSFNNINKVLLNLNKRYYRIKIYEKSNKINQTGGSMKNYKKIVKDTKTIIIYYRDMINDYYFTNINFNSKCKKLFSLIQDSSLSFSLIQDNIDNNITDLKLFDDSFKNFKGGGIESYLKKIKDKIEFINKELIQFYNVHDEFKRLGAKIDNIQILNKGIEFIITNIKTIKKKNLLEILKIITLFIKDESPKMLIHNLVSLKYLTDILNKEIKTKFLKSEKELENYKEILDNKILDINNHNIPDYDNLYKEKLIKAEEGPVEEADDKFSLEIYGKLLEELKGSPPKLNQIPTATPKPKSLLQQIRERYNELPSITTRKKK